MKKLAIMAVVALIAGPAIATEPIGPEGTVGVEINVVAYCAVEIAPAPMVMEVNDIQAPGGSPVIDEGHHEATTTFQVVGNDTFTVTVTPAYKSNSTIWTPGSEGGEGDEWPTAYTGGAPNTPGTNGIGFGLSIRNLTDATSDPWSPTEGDCHLPFSPGVSDAKLTINTYLDSGRSDIPGPFGGELAEIGTYTSTLTLTLTP